MDYMQLARKLFGGIPDEKPPSMTQLTNTQPQEQAGGKEIVDRNVERAIEQWQPRSAPNPYELGELRNIYNQKDAWGAADALAQNPTAYAKANGLTEDAVRALAEVQKQAEHDSAERSRYQLNSAGLGIGGYSAFDDTLECIQNQLLSRQAQDITEALQGAYHMTANQYYDHEYNRAIARGYSPDRAREIAGSIARKYQANRVAYLDGLYNSYGRDESQVTTGIGMQILGMIAQDNPMLANVYAQAYPTPRDAYNTENEMAKQVLQNDQAVKLLGIEQDNTLQRIAAQLAANKDYATHTHGCDVKPLEKTVRQNARTSHSVD